MAHEAVPMLCIPKKSSKLHTVFDLGEQNDNTVKNVTLFPDQDIICNDMARAAYCSKLDMSKAYKQICIIPEHCSNYRVEIGTVGIKNLSIWLTETPQ